MLPFKVMVDTNVEQDVSKLRAKFSSISQQMIKL